MNTAKEITVTYKEFCDRDGNQHIASEYAIRKLQKLIEKFRIGNVLEVGLGIGSISGSLLKVNKHLNYSGTEANDYCLKTLPQNLTRDHGRLKIYESLKVVPCSENFDLIIIDGKDPDLESLKEMLSERAIIAMEGDRVPQQEVLKELFPKSLFVHSISLSKNKIYSPFSKEDWQGGLKVIFVNPGLTQKLWWVKEKLLTKLKYQYPGRHFGGKPSLKK